MNLEQTLKSLNEKYGAGAIVKGANARGLKLNRIKSGSLAVDACTGGGFPAGKITEIYGPYSGGKSYLSQLTLAQIQKDYPTSNNAWIDFEGAFDDDWARKIGINTDNLLLSAPEYMEDGLEIAVNLIKSGEVFSIFIDSLAAACPKAEYEGAMEDFSVGLRARLGNKFVRKSQPKVDLTSDELDLGQTTLFIINQTYTNIGGYGDLETTPGGQQVKFGAMMRLKIRRGELVNSKDGSIIMQESKFTVTKNKTSPPGKIGSFWFSIQDNPKGKRGQIYKAGEVITIGVLSGVIRRAGPWYYLPEIFGEEKFQGEAKLAEWVTENPEKYAKLEETVLEEMSSLKI